MTEDCPICGADLRGEPIPEEYQREGLYGQPAPTHYSRKIGVEVRGVYDGILFWHCPVCDGNWHRFEHNHWLRQRAEEQMQKAKEERDASA